MALSELADGRLHLAARRAYERGRGAGAVARGAAAIALAAPAFLLCGGTPMAALCLAGFGTVVAVGRFLGRSYELGSRAGALAGLLPCLVPAALTAFRPDFCFFLQSQGFWVIAAAGAAAGTVLGLRGRQASGWPFWGSAALALGFGACLGCLFCGTIGFIGLGAGLIVVGGPIVAVRRRLV